MPAPAPTNDLTLLDFLTGEGHDALVMFNSLIDKFGHPSNSREMVSNLLGISLTLLPLLDQVKGAINAMKADGVSAPESLPTLRRLRDALDMAIQWLVQDFAPHHRRKLMRCPITLVECEHGCQWIHSDGPRPNAGLPCRLMQEEFDEKLDLVRKLPKPVVKELLDAALERLLEDALEKDPEGLDRALREAMKKNETNKK